MPKAKTIMRSLEINEISAVDRPAQAGARKTLMKRDNSIVDKDYNGTPNPETDSAEEAAVNKARTDWLTANPGKTEADLPENLRKTETSTKRKENDMTDATKEVDALKKAHKEETDKLTAELDTTKKVAALTDSEKEFYGKLADADKPAFLAKTADERKALVTKAAEGDPVMYKSVAGIEYRKSAGEAMIALAKQADDNMKLAKDEKEKRETADLKKRAGDLLKNMTGTEDEKTELLKAVEGIKDETLRKKATEMLTSANTALAAAFVRKGAGGGTDASSSAVDALEVLAKKEATEKKISFEKAYANVLQTKEGSDLYAQTLKQ